MIKAELRALAAYFFDKGTTGSFVDEIFRRRFTAEWATSSPGD